MSSITPPAADRLRLQYPDSDGKLMADNTLQFRWIVTIQGALDDLFRDRSDVFVAGDLLWYPVEGHSEIRAAPDTLVAFGRPKGDRGSYMQWLENGVAPQVVFEVLSPGNRHGEMIHKFRFYERHGVEEYYIYDPDHAVLEGWRRVGQELQEIPAMHGWVSPRLGIRFDTSGEELQLFRPDGRRFATYLELAAQRDEERQAREQAQHRADQERKAREEAEQRAERLAAQLRALGEDPGK
jgi:Uma2 family endonuclease